MTDKEPITVTLEPPGDAERYPLWCVDRGLEFGESRYRGPFGSSDESTVECRGFDYRVRRCRRVLATEIMGVPDLDYITETAEDRAHDGSMVNEDAWADYDEAIVTAKAGAQAALAAWADEFLDVRAFVCEGDE